jgi:hypothetical protein
LLGAWSGSFRAYVPAWALDENEQIVRHTVTLDERWLSVLDNFQQRVADLRDAMYKKSPAETKQLITAALLEATRVHAKETITVPIDVPFALDDGPGEIVSIKVAKADDYSESIWVNPEDIASDKARMTVYAPGYNNKTRGYIKKSSGVLAEVRSSSMKSSRGRLGWFLKHGSTLVDAFYTRCRRSSRAARGITVWRKSVSLSTILKQSSTMLGRRSSSRMSAIGRDLILLSTRLSSPSLILSA